MPVLKRYNGTDWEVVGEAARPATRGGTLAYAEVSTAQTGIGSSATPLNGLSVTVTVPAGRRLRISGGGLITQQTAGSSVAGQIQEDGVEVGRWFRQNPVGINEFIFQTGSTVRTPTAGTHTYRLTLATSAGTVDFTGTAANPGFILVEDITGTPYVAGEAPPGALLAYVEQINSLSNIGTAEVDVPELAVTITVPEGRRIKLSAMALPISNSGANNKFNVKIMEGSTKIAYGEVNLLTSPHNAGTVEASRIISPTAGTHTYKVVGQFNAGATNMLYRDHSFGQVPYLRIEDVTGSPMPYDPASVPVGLLGWTAYQGTQGGITATSAPGTQITGLNPVNVVVPAGRTLKVAVQGYHWNSTANMQTSLRIMMDGAEIHGMADRAINANGPQLIRAERIISPSAGAHTFTVYMSVAGGSGTFGGEPAFLSVEDITPTPAPSSGAPGSTLGYAEVVTNQGSITTTETDLTGLAVTVTVPAGRRIRIRVEGLFQSTVANDLAYLRIKEGSTIYQISSMALLSADAMKKTGEVIITPPAGTHTYKATLARTSGSGNISLVAGATFPAYILVEDITGSVWPEGSAVTAGMVASEVWTGWTPVVSQGVTPAQSISYAKYYKIGRMVVCQASIGFTGSGTAANNIVITGYPVPAASGSPMIGTFRMFDAGNTNFVGTINGSGTNAWIIHHDGDGNSLGAGTGTITNGDFLQFQCIYEAAS